jgi:hypothetical protein
MCLGTSSWPKEEHNLRGAYQEMQCWLDAGILVIVAHCLLDHLRTCMTITCAQTKVHFDCASTWAYSHAVHMGILACYHKVERHKTCVWP